MLKDFLLYPNPGGSVILAVNREALQEATERNIRLATVDVFTEEMADFSLVFETVEHSCTIEPTLTETGNLQLAIVAKGDNSSESCHEKARVSQTYILYRLAWSRYQLLALSPGFPACCEAWG